MDIVPYCPAGEMSALAFWVIQVIMWIVIFGCGFFVGAIKEKFTWLARAARATSGTVGTLKTTERFETTARFEGTVLFVNGRPCQVCFKNEELGTHGKPLSPTPQQPAHAKD